MVVYGYQLLSDRSPGEVLIEEGLCDLFHLHYGVNTESKLLAVFYLRHWSVSDSSPLHEST